MSFGRTDDVFLAVQDQLDRFSGFKSRQGGMHCEQHGIILFAAETAAGGQLNNPDSFLGPAQGLFQRIHEVIGTLHGAADSKAFLFIKGNHGLGFQIGLFLVACAEFVFYKEAGVFNGLLNIALVIGIFYKAGFVFKYILLLRCLSLVNVQYGFQLFIIDPEFWQEIQN